MIRFLFRILATIALAVAVVLAVLDATRSVAENAIVMTPLGSAWYAVSPETLNLAQAAVQRHLAPALWDPVIVRLLTMPAFAVFAVLALVLYLVGRRPGIRSGRVGHYRA